MGTKTVLNEFIAYVDLAQLPAGALSPRSRLIMTYALCGFANFGSLGILIGGMTAMVPERRKEIVALGIPSIAAGPPAEPINVVIEDSRLADVLYVGTDLGVYVSLDAGGSWHSLVANLPSTPVYDLVMHPREDELIAATHGPSRRPAR